jgi:DNA-binding NtrC family response regulator
MPRGNGEVVLVVEDNQDLREASVAQLTMLGYDVIEADGSAAALAAIESSVRSVDLLFTDIVMPGTMNGYELANEVTVRRPTVKVLLASGFPGETLERTEPHIRKWQLLRKPYRMEELGRAVHAALQRPTSEEVG